jgi:fibro-slime domain-containing protein
MKSFRLAVLTSAVVLSACGAGADGTVDNANGSNGQSGGGATPPLLTGPGGSGPGGGSLGDTAGSLTITIRDFKLYSAGDASTNPDFENTPKTDQNGTPSTSYLGPWDDLEIVADAIGKDQKPVYKKATGQTLTTHGKAAFDQWFRDVSGTNIPTQYPLTLELGTDGAYGYDSLQLGVALGGGSTDKMFFPIDDGSQYATTFGDQGLSHNYSFTVELHTKFTYKGGEYFHFSGDDDVFVFINGKLAINLGGIHGREEATAEIDKLGLTLGTSYPLDFFYAERHVVASNLRVTTTLALEQVNVR